VDENWYGQTSKKMKHSLIPMAAALLFTLHATAQTSTNTTCNVYGNQVNCASTSTDASTQNAARDAQQAEQQREAYETGQALGRGIAGAIQGRRFRKWVSKYCEENPGQPWWYQFDMSNPASKVSGVCGGSDVIASQRRVAAAEEAFQEAQRQTRIVIKNEQNSAAMGTPCPDGQTRHLTSYGSDCEDDPKKQQIGQRELLSNQQEQNGFVTAIPERPVDFSQVDDTLAYAYGHWSALDTHSELTGPSVSEISCDHKTCRESQANIVSFGDTFTMNADTVEYTVERYNSKEIVASNVGGICHVRNVIKFDRIGKRVYSSQTLSEPSDNPLCKGVGMNLELKDTARWKR
jgi:hypothetical protein